MLDLVLVGLHVDDKDERVVVLNRSIRLEGRGIGQGGKRKVFLV